MVIFPHQNQLVFLHVLRRGSTLTRPKHGETILEPSEFQGHTDNPEQSSIRPYLDGEELWDLRRQRSTVFISCFVSGSFSADVFLTEATWSSPTHTHVTKERVVWSPPRELVKMRVPDPFLGVQTTALVPKSLDSQVFQANYLSSELTHLLICYGWLRLLVKAWVGCFSPPHPHPLLIDHLVMVWFGIPGLDSAAGYRH